MKHLLAASLLSLVSIAAVGCADDSELDLMNEIARPGFEVILVDAVDNRPELTDPDLERAPGAGDLSSDSNGFYGGADTVLTDDGNRVVDTSPDAELSPGAVTTDSPDPDPLNVENPCDCLGQDCRQQWVEDNLGCNVCAVFTCGEELRPHACNPC